MPNNNNNNAAAAAAGTGASLTGIAPSAMSTGYFQGAPLTKLYVMIFILSQFVLKNNHHHKKHMNSNNSNSAGSTTGQVIMAGMFLLPLLRKLERELGSAKYFAWMVVTLGISIGGMLQVLQILIGEYYWQEIFFNNNIDKSNNSIGGSTTGNNSNNHHFHYYDYHPILVGAVLFWYIRFVPRLYPRFVSIAGIPLSEKALYGIWGAYVILSGGTWSVVTSFLGALSSAGLLATTGGNQLLSLLTPEWLSNNNRSLDSLGSLLLLDPPAKIYAPMMAAMMMNNNINAILRGTAGAAGAGAGRNNIGAAAAAAARAPVRRAPPSPPPQAAIDQLTAMGFEESQVRQALQQSGNNVERAADRLLSG